MRPIGRKIGWGIVGCGDIANKRVVPAIQGLTNTQLVACVRRDAKRVVEFQSRYGISKGYGNYAEFLKDSELETVYLATPVWLHCSQAIEAAEKGKHVLCEKPMAMNTKECGRMIDACRINGVKLGVAYYRRFYPVVLKIQEIIRQGLIGEPIFVRSTLVEHARLDGKTGLSWRFVPEQGGGGLLMDVASHRLDLLVMLFGQPESISAFTDIRTCPIDVEDTGSLLIRFTSGLHATVFSSHCIKHPRDDFEIFGSEGSLKVSPLNSNRLEVIKDNVKTFDLPKADNVHQPLLEDFNRAIIEDRQPVVPGEEGLKTSLLLEAAYESACSGRVVGIDPSIRFLGG